MNVWLVTPAHGRERLAAVCLEQRARMADELRPDGLTVKTVVIADDGNLDTARQLGHHTIRRANRPLGAKFNAGIRYALDHGADWIGMSGSDDFVHPDYLAPLANLPDDAAAYTTRHSTVVREDGHTMAHICVTYPGGDGTRIYRADMLHDAGAGDERERAIDTSILKNLEATHGRVTWRYAPADPELVVDFKSPHVQLNPYRDTLRAFGTTELADPFQHLARLYPDDLVAKVETVYAEAAW